MQVLTSQLAEENLNVKLISRMMQVLQQVIAISDDDTVKVKKKKCVHYCLRGNNIVQ